VVPSSPSVIDALGLALVSGRRFDDHDTADAKVAIVSAPVARKLFGTSEVVGRRVMVSGPARPQPESLTIVGVTAGAGRQTASGDQLVFVPLQSLAEGGVTILVRSRQPAVAVALLRSLVQRQTEMLAISASDTAAGVLQRRTYVLRKIAQLSMVLGAVALLLATGGLYAMLARSVTLRTREIGIRAAMGANHHRILGLVLREGLSPVLKGLVLGLGIGAISSLAVRAFVVTDISAVDPLLWALIASGMLFVASLACYVPALRAARVEPTIALRHL
jgi:putative ABC transport system permease protein